jgi:hypothetical protein
MDENLRFEPGRKEPEVQTIQDFQIAWVFWERQKNAMVLEIAGNRPQLVEVCVQVIERR